MQEAEVPANTHPILRFARALAIVGGGDSDPEVLTRLAADGVAVIAADGGAWSCERAGIIPQAIVGDLDSLGDVDKWAGRSRLVRIDEQVSTDFEKCLYSTEAPLTIALGVTGRRFDHTLAALSAVARFAATRRVVVVGEEDIAIGCVGRFAFAADKGERVSVFPLEDVQFSSSSGLEYPLDGLKLGIGGRTGVSNKALGGDVTIEPVPGNTGVWLLMLGQHHLWRMLESQGAH
ncbi:MAG TPA: thiamine diphosphokinase [Devosiaceae bacterium]